MLNMASDTRGPWALASIVKSSGQLWPALVLLAVIVAPSQELYYRALVLQGARGYKPAWLVALVAGLFFGLMSTSGIHIVATSLAGFVLSYAWLKRGAYLELVAAHWAWAACALLVWNYMRFWPV
jgi:membrane protease YdiL (CAAX protease family)